MFVVDVQGKQRILPILTSFRGVALTLVVVTYQEVASIPFYRWQGYLHQELRPRLLDDRCHIVVIGEEVTVLT